MVTHRPPAPQGGLVWVALKDVKDTLRLRGAERWLGAKRSREAGFDPAALELLAAAYHPLPYNPDTGEEYGAWVEPVDSMRVAAGYWPRAVKKAAADA
jgi:hypothetical protein